MRELLPDNVGLLHHMDTLDNTGILSSLPAYARPKLREVNSILSWVSCFTMYIAVFSQRHPHLIQSHLAYMALIVAETRRNGGEGWQPYDMVFRQHAANDDSVDWSAVDHSLHSSTFGRNKLSLFCISCAGTDHSTEDCVMRVVTMQPALERPRQRAHTSSQATPICLRWNRENCVQPDCSYRQYILLCLSLCPSWVVG